MKIKIFLIILILLTCFIVNPYFAYASVIKQNNSKEGIKVYYVSTQEENFFAMSLIKAQMEKEVYIIYSDKMANRENLYLYDMTKYDYLPQVNVRNVSYNIGNFYSASVSYQTLNNGTTKAHYRIYYRSNEKETNYVYDKVHNAIKDNIKNLKTDYQKAYWAYRWVIDNLHYDETYKHSSAYDGFQKTGTLCQGYATLYCAVANELGLECSYVGGTVKKDGSGDHAWNLVRLDGEWYCVDTTWGDSVYGDKYFLKSPDTFSSSEYGYHQSQLYQYYIDNGENLSKLDYIDKDSNTINPLSPSVFNVNIDYLKQNKLSIMEKYKFLINNPDNIQLTFVSTNSSIVKINKYGVATGISKGNATIIVYNAKLGISQSCQITVE